MNTGLRLFSYSAEKSKNFLNCKQGVGLSTIVFPKYNIYISIFFNSLFNVSLIKIFIFVADYFLPDLP